MCTREGVGGVWGFMMKKCLEKYGIRGGGTCTCHCKATQEYHGLPVNTVYLMIIFDYLTRSNISN